MSSVLPCHNTRVRVQHLSYPPGTSVSSVRPCHNTRNFWEFCNTFIPVPENSGSAVRLPYACPESTNPTEHNLEIMLIFCTPWQYAMLLLRPLFANDILGRYRHARCHRRAPTRRGKALLVNMYSTVRFVCTETYRTS